MALLSIGLAIQEIILIVIILLLLIGVVKYGKDTPLGYLGSFILCIALSPILAFLIIFILKKIKQVN